MECTPRVVSHRCAIATLCSDISGTCERSEKNCGSLASDICPFCLLNYIQLAVSPQLDHSDMLGVVAAVCYVHLALYQGDLSQL